MKNIHILPSDKPSRLQLNVNTGKLILFDNIQSEKESVHLSNQHIYITSDEIGKHSEYVYWGKDTERPIKFQRGEYLGAKKIILTTDPTLIADGVQAIDDEFLEWFVKNPTCEYVRAEKDKRLEIEQDFEFYEIIIPKQEPKQDLEDFIKREGYSDGPTQDIWKDGVMEGAKWQSERTYSEDEVRALIIKALTHNDYDLCGSLATRDWEIRPANFNVWFDHNKK